MNRISTRIDRAKQQLYFPAAKGFRFSTGAGGVYMAAQDLFLSEVRPDVHCAWMTVAISMHKAGSNCLLGPFTRQKCVRSTLRDESFSQHTPAAYVCARGQEVTDMCASLTCVCVCVCASSHHAGVRSYHHDS